MVRENLRNQVLSCWLQTWERTKKNPRICRRLGGLNPLIKGVSYQLPTGKREFWTPFRLSVGSTIINRRRAPQGNKKFFFKQSKYIILNFFVQAVEDQTPSTKSQAPNNIQ